MEPAPSHDPELYEPEAVPLHDSGVTPAARGDDTLRDRVAVLFEVLLCSGVPTQLLIGQALTHAGWSPFTESGVPQAGPLFVLALVDTVVLLVLITALQHARGLTMRGLLLGNRGVGREAVLGLALVPVLFLCVGVTVLALRSLVPALHNVPENPFEQLVRTPRDAGLFSVVAIVAGGLKEEVQRAFLLRRFTTHLGGPAVGLAIVSVAFGAGHIVQGLDAAVATGLLGLAWGVTYLRRGSAVAAIVSHAGYNGSQVLQLMLVRGLPI